MLKTTAISTAKKTAGCAVTYRAGTGDKFATCPASCSLNPSGRGCAEIDEPYLDAVLSAVPRRGVSFTYSHFDPIFGFINWPLVKLSSTTARTVYLMPIRLSSGARRL